MSVYFSKNKGYAILNDFDLSIPLASNAVMVHTAREMSEDFFKTSSQVKINSALRINERKDGSSFLCRSSLLELSGLLAFK